MPPVVICATSSGPPPFTAVNQSAPSGPEVIKPGVRGAGGGGGSGYSVKAPAVVIRQMLPWGELFGAVVNHNAPCEPVAIALGVLCALGIVYSVIVAAPRW